MDSSYGGGGDVGRSSGDDSMASIQRRHQENRLDYDNTHFPLPHFPCCWLQGRGHDNFHVIGCLIHFTNIQMNEIKIKSYHFVTFS